MSTPQWIEPDWPAPPNVRAAATARSGGVSQGAYASLNLGAHVGDDPQAVAENRRRASTALGLRAEPLWLQQVHGIDVVEARAQSAPPAADASFARSPDQVCAILTADCLPVLLCDKSGKSVAAAHAGWRGLAGGVLAATVAALAEQPQRLMAWFGPAIEQDAFEVGDEVREAFVNRAAQFADAFVPNARGRWQADLYALARRELARLGVHEVYGGGYRCYADAQRFFSYRRDGRTGRMATLIWLEH
jgi:polyphenol oxidase